MPHLIRRLFDTQIIFYLTKYVDDNNGNRIKHCSLYINLALAKCGYPFTELIAQLK